MGDRPTRETGHLFATIVETDDGPRKVIVPPTDPREREAQSNAVHRENSRRAAEWRFEIKLPQHLADAGYSVGKGWGMNSWWVQYPRGGWTIGWLDPGPAIEAAQEHFDRKEPDHG